MSALFHLYLCGRIAAEWLIKMKEPINLNIIDEEFYSTHFSLYSEEFEDRIYFYAECSRNPDARKKDAYYFLELFFSVGEYGAREFLIGVTLGNDAMDKKSLDYEIRTYLISQLDDDFPLLVQQYLKKEHLLEDWLDEQEGH